MPKKTTRSKTLPKRTANTSRRSITEVTSVISHQLKTPLSGIKSSLEVLLSGELGAMTKQQREYLELALGGAKKMIGLVKNLLDASRIDENRMQLNVEDADLVAIARAVVQDLGSFARAKNSRIEVRVIGEIPALRMDATKVQEVINNLVYNAIRYTKGKGEIVVTVERDGAFALFSCADNGIGISAAEAKKIFTKFYRSPRVVEIATDGSGLGLFISRAIIREHGGRIWFKSRPGKGTTFYFTLPIKRVQ